MNKEFYLIIIHFVLYYSILFVHVNHILMHVINNFNLKIKF